MLTHEQHLERILASVTPGAHRTVALDGPAWPCTLLGSVLAADVTSTLAWPSFTNSAMDGYAVRAADLAQATGPGLPVAGDVAAGDTRVLTLVPGTAWRIMTGAAVPWGADSIVPVEVTDAGVEHVRVTGPAPAHRHLRHAGEDVAAGDVVLPAGTRLGPHHVAVLASCGRTAVEVVARPKVLVLSTGDELVPAGRPLQHGQIHDSNGPMLAALVQAAGAEVLGVAHVRDDEGAVAEALADAIADADAVITTGGVSAGAFDVVKSALLEAGEVTFDKVAMQPGKPQGFGLLGERRVPVFTLPGNPMSTLVSFHVFVLPALRCMAGAAPAPPLRGVADQGWRSPAGRAQFARVSVRRDGAGRIRVVPNARQGSHHLGELAWADALAVVPADVEHVEAGDELDVIMLLNGENR